MPQSRTLWARLPRRVSKTDTLFAQYNDRLVSHHTAELLSESETRFFERMSGSHVTFSRDTRGKVTRLTAQFPGANFSFAKISDQPPKAYERPKPRVAIKLDAKLYDAYVGHYEFAPGINLTIWRQGDQLMAEDIHKGVKFGAFEIYPESEKKFFLAINGAQFTFIRNVKGEVTALVVHFYGGAPDCMAKKVKK